MTSAGRDHTKIARARRACGRLLPLLAVLGSVVAASPGAAEAAVPPIRHVWVINEENGQICISPAFNPAASAEGKAGCPVTSPDPGAFFGSVLPNQGTLVENYFGIGHESLDNYIAEVSGQAPNPDTQADCAQSADLTPGTPGPRQQSIGQGCYYPNGFKDPTNGVQTIADQLDPHHADASGTVWKSYQEDMGRSLAQDVTANCSLANGTIVGPDEYLAKHNPFTWFHSITDDRAYCDAHVVPLSALRADLQRIDTTPNLSFITPNMANDGHDAPSTAASAWAGYWVRLIMASPAYRQDGMIVIVYDENSDSSTAGATAGEITFCCGEVPGPNSPSPGAFGSQGGGQTGAWVLTPYGKPKTVTSAFSYNHYSLLRTLEDLFGITTGGADNQGHLGYAGGNGASDDGGAAYKFRSFGCEDIFIVPNKCPPTAGDVQPPLARPVRENLGPRVADGSARWLNPSPQGNDLNAISCSTATACVAVGATGAIVSTEDAGTSWSPRSSGTAADLTGVSCPVQSDSCVAVGAGGAILRSSDTGTTWARVPSGTHADLGAVACPSQTACHAVGAGGAIVGTKDGGATWATESSQPAQDLVGIACPNTNTCYASGDFEPAPAPSGTNQNPQPRAHVLLTGDGGRTWSSRTVSGAPARLRGVACTDATNCVTGDEAGAPYTTGDGFQNVSARGAAPGRLMGAACVPGGTTCVLVGEFGSIARSVNGTLSVARALWLSSGVDLSAVSCPSATACYAVGRHGAILGSGDGGTTWTASGSDAAATNFSSRTTEPTNQGGNAVGGNTIGSLDLGGASCPAPKSCIAVGALGAVLASGDEGSSWLARRGVSGPASAPFHSPPGSFDPSASNQWVPARIPETPDTGSLASVSCPSSKSCVAVGELDKVATTSDAEISGGAWAIQTLNGLQYAGTLTGVSCPKGTDTCFAVGDYGTVVKSTDSGGHWAAQDSGTTSFLNGVSCPDTTHCVAVGVQGTVLDTTDGAHWQAGASSTAAYLSSVSCPSASSCLAVGSAGTVLGSDDGGRTWSARNAPSGDDLYGVSCIDGTCVATGSAGTVASTADGGNTWNVQGTGTTDALLSVTCESASACFAAGQNGALLRIAPHPPEARGSGGGGGGGGGGGSEPGVPVFPGAVCAGLAAPTTWIGTHAFRISHGRVSFTGRAFAHRCAAVANRIARVEVAVQKKMPRGRCRFVTASGRLTSARTCRRPVFVAVSQRAHGLTAVWTFRSTRPLPRGRYTVLARARDREGTVERAHHVASFLLR